MSLGCGEEGGGGLSVAVQCRCFVIVGFAGLAEGTVLSECSWGFFFSAASTHPVQKPQLSSDTFGGTVVMVLSVSLQPRGWGWRSKLHLHF